MKKNVNDMKNVILEKEKMLLILKNNSEKKIQLVLDRIKKDIDNVHKYSLSNIMVSLLPDIDSLEQAIMLSKKENDHFFDIINQLNTILELFLNLFKIYNITVIDSINVPFDPSIHQAIVLSCSKTVKSNHIIKVMQKGYKLHQRLLRPAMVIVSE